MILPSIPELKDINDRFENGAQYLTKDSFNFHAQLGSGAFGKVYKVSSKLTGSHFALKVLSKNQITSLKLTEQLKKEIAIIARCSHENIIKLFGAFEDKSYIYLIMELAAEGTLFSKLKKTKKLPESLAAAYLTDIVKAIIYLHSQKPAIIHRDLKPENILLSENKCKIADFGWSNITDEFRNTFCGTPDYLAPEMIIGTGHDEKLDVWTVGVMMYELIEGTPPFTAKDKINDARVMQKLIEKNILSGNIEFGKEISEDAKNAIRIMLNPKAEFRPSAKEILQLQFFKKFLANQASQPVASSEPKTSLDAQDIGQLRMKLAEYRDRLVGREEHIRQLNDTVEKKEAMIRSLTRENETAAASQAKLIAEISQLRSGSQRASGPNELADLTEKYKVLTNELIAQEERMAYVLRRMKHVSETVSEFYQSNVLGVNAAPLPPSAITYENSLLKLEQIFKDFLKYKAAALGQKADTSPAPQTPRTVDSMSNLNDKGNIKPNMRNFSPMVNKPAEEKKNMSGSIEKILQDSKSALAKFFRKAD